MTGDLHVTPHDGGYRVVLCADRNSHATDPIFGFKQTFDRASPENSREPGLGATFAVAFTLMPIHSMNP